MGVWVEVDVIGCVTGGRGVRCSDGVLVPSIEFVSGVIVRSGSMSDALEQPTASIINNNSKNNCFMSTWSLPATV